MELADHRRRGPPKAHDPTGLARTLSVQSAITSAGMVAPREVPRLTARVVIDPPCCQPCWDTDSGLPVLVFAALGLPALDVRVDDACDDLVVSVHGVPPWV